VSFLSFGNLTQKSQTVLVSKVSPICTGLANPKIVEGVIAHGLSLGVITEVTGFGDSQVSTGKIRMLLTAVRTFLGFTLRTSHAVKPVDRFTAITVRASSLLVWIRGLRPRFTH